MKRLIRSIFSVARGVSPSKIQASNEERDRQLILESGLFDPEFYGKSYPDVLAAQQDPLDHYIKHGRKEGRQPSAQFSPKAYLQANPDLDPDSDEPVMHYILQGKAEGRVDRFSSKIDSMERAKLKSFLASSRLFSWLNLSTQNSPLVSAVLVVHQNAEAILSCLEALQLEAVQNQISMEVILVDNASRDETPLLLRRLDGVQCIVNSSDVGFAIAANQGADAAQGKYLLFLKSGALPASGAVKAALQAMSASTGAVGGKVVSTTGKLIEAGGLLLGDGQAGSFSGEILAKEVLFRRRVLFVSADFLLTPSEAFKKVGKFSSDPNLTGFEEVDYSLRLAEMGQAIVYDPEVCVFRRNNDDQTVCCREKNRPMLLVKHPKVFERLAEISRKQIDPLFQAYSSGKRLLYIDDRLPLTHLGAGFPRTKQFIESLVAQNFQISFLPLSEREPDLAEIRVTLPLEVQVITLSDRASLGQFLADKAGAYDIIVISRIHNLAETHEALRELKSESRPFIVYDAEAIFADRSLALAALRESEPMRQAALDARAKEFEHAKSANLILSVSKSEVNDFSEATHRPVLRLGTYFDVIPSPRSFSERRGFLILASYHGAGTPNHDGLCWFLKQVWPLIDKAALGPVQVVGYRAPGVEMPPMPQNVNFLGQVDDLGPFFNECRVFIAPTRFASGIPLKCVESASYGLPMVITGVLSKNLGWNAGVDHLSASQKDAGAFARECTRLYKDADLWESIRIAALERIGREYSRPVFEGQVAEAFGSQRGVEPR